MITSYTRYYNEGFTPQSGIDTITVWIHPAIVNQPWMFHEQGNNNAAINLRFKQEIDSRTNRVIRTNHIVDIQAECIDPNHDIYEQVIMLLTQLTYDGILCCPKKHDMCDIANFFLVNFDRLFALEKLDFYHDLHSEDALLLGEPNPNYPNTRYNQKYPSVLKAYHRQERLIQKRHIPYEKIQEIEYPFRIEFALRRGNCEYLNIRNLIGTYENVFLRYLPFLARQWFKFRHEIIKIINPNLSYAHHLRQIIAVARQHIPPYTGLLHTPLKPIPYKTARKNEVDYNFIAEYYGSHRE